MEESAVITCDEVEEAAIKLNKVMSEVGDILVEREDELIATKLCLLTKQHLMLEGPPGIAKSMLAREVFSRIKQKGLVVFKKQLMPNTQTDEVFGPLDSRKYRDDAEYEMRIEGYLPSAHFAFLDEVYRAANMILPAMLGILNEREFQNGITHITCPLHMAIATSNFVSDNPELTAFHDRWLVRIATKPLSDSNSRIKALRAFLNPSADNEITHLTLAEIQFLGKALSGIKVEEDHFTLYEELVSHLRKALPQIYISDRRMIQSFQLALAAMFLGVNEAEEKGVELVLDPALLHFTRFGLITVNKKEETDAFENVYQRVVGDYARDRELQEKLQKVAQYSVKLEQMYEDELEPDDLALLYVKVKRGMSGLADLAQSNVTISSNMQDKIQKVQKRFDGLEKTLVAAKVDMKLVTKVVEQLKRKQSV